MVEKVDVDPDGNIVKDVSKETTSSNIKQDNVTKKHDHEDNTNHDAHDDVHDDAHDDANDDYYYDDNYDDYYEDDKDSKYKTDPSKELHKSPLVTKIDGTRYTCSQCWVLISLISESFIIGRYTYPSNCNMTITVDCEYLLKMFKLPNSTDVKFVIMAKNETSTTLGFANAQLDNFVSRARIRVITSL